MKKVLIVCYYWPPAGGPGVQRWLNFVKYLPEFGVEPILYVPENPNYPMEDTSFLTEIPKSVRVVKQPIFEPYKLASIFSGKKTKQISKGIISKKKQGVLEKFLLWVRGNFFIPDARVFWVKPSVKFLEKFLQQEKIDTIITTGPPHSLHLIGLRLKSILEINWIADFRDPWTTIGYHSELKLSKKSKTKHKKLEQAVLTTADKIIVTSFTTKAEFELITKRPIEIITNGFLDTEEEYLELNKNFTLSHIGSLLSGRNPFILWEVLGELVKEDETFKNDFQLQLAGAVSEDVLETIKEHNLQSNLSLLGYVSHDEALQLQRSASALLLIEIDAVKTRGIIPGKLFEYLASKRPIVAIGPEKWDVFRILNETKAGTCFLYTEKEKLKEEVLLLYKNFKNNTLYINSEGIAKYHRKSLTEQLATLIK